MNKWQTFGLGMAIVSGLLASIPYYRHGCPDLDLYTKVFFSPFISLCILGIWLLICGKSPDQRNIIRLSFVIGFTTGLVALVAGVIYSGIFYPTSNQGPLLGYFFTGPIGLAVGIIVGIPIAFIINERKKKLNLLHSFILIFIIFLVSCSTPPAKNSPTVDGPEAENLLIGTQGYIVYDFPIGGMKATSLSDLKEITIRQEGNSSQGVVHSLSGPDHIGTIAYIENHMELVSSKHKLKTINIDGKNDEVIFSRSGDALWDHVAGNFLALSPIGGFVALICNVKDCDIGTLEIWDIKKKKNLDVKLPAFNAPLSWFPDGTMLAYTGVRNQNGKNMSSIFIYDLKENKNNFFANGEGALVSPDGKSIIIGQADHSLALFNYKTKVSRTLKIPGLVGFPMGFANNNRILAFCLPTKGGPAQWTKNNSPLVGAKPIIAIKIIDLETGEFQTVLNSVDPRREVSFGKTIKD